MTDRYQTIKGEAQGEYKEKGSKFYAFAYPVFTREEVNEKLKTLKKSYYDARHHVYAFRLGADMQTYRSSDDGEPSNSSGPPVMGQIRSFGLTNILVVVVRYFGGTKLGVPGLINAYKTAARDALEHATVKTYTIDREITMRLAYTDVDRVMSVLQKNKLQILDQQFAKDVTLRFAVPLSEADALLARLTKLETVKVLKNEGED